MIAPARVPAYHTRVEKRFYVVPGYAHAAYLIAFGSLVFATIVVAVLPTDGVTLALVAFAVLVAVLVASVARFTRTTPIVVLGERELVLRVAMLAKERVIPFDALSGFSIADGYVAFVPKSGEPARLPVTSLTKEDLQALIVELESRVRRPSKHPAA